MTDLTPAQQALRHLELLGKDPDAAWFRAIRHGKGANSRRDGADLLGFDHDALRADAIDGHSLYLVVGDASAASGKAGGVTDADITSVPALFVEWDDLSTDEQLTAWHRLGLPKPTLMLATGGKSVHAYWRLDQPLPPAQWKAVTARLIDHCQSDKACKNPARVMRLAGSLYIDKDTGKPTGARAEIAHEAPEAIYHLEQITSCLPEPQFQAPTSAPPSPPPPSDQLPVEQLLSRDLLRTWEQGAPEGQRNATAFSLACSLLAHHDAAIAAGLPITGTPEDALLQFGRRCSPPIDDREIKALFRSACSAPRTTDPGWPDRLRYHLNRKARQQRVEAQAARAAAAPPPHDDDDAPKQHAPEPIKASNGYYTCLGFDDGNYYYQPSSTGQITRLSRGNHTETHLLSLVPDLGYWESLFPAKSGVNWSSAKANLFAQQHAIGIFSPDRIRGRGAWWDDGRSVLHLGDRLIVDGITHSVMQPPPSRFSYQRLAAIDLPSDLDPLTDQQGLEIIDIASRFLWEVPASGLLIAGWAALAPICGSLAWRPHIWLTASAGSGKSALLDRYLGTLLDSLALWPEGSTSEASIRQELRADALPVIMDEAESNELADRKRIQDILALARVASSSGRGFVGRGGADGAAQRFTIRSMFLLCSISTALKQGADASRFAQLTLRHPSCLPLEQRQSHWTDLDLDLTTTITPQLGYRMALRSVGLIPVIRDSVAVFRRAAANRFDSQRQADQYGTLLAGAWSLMNSRIATEADAYALIDSNDWSHYREASELPDECRCLQHILQHQIRVEADDRICSRTLGELVEIAIQHRMDNEITTRQAIDALSRHGLKVETNTLMVSNTAQAIASILRDTPWGNGWSTILSRITGAQRTGPVRFSGAGAVSRAIAIPIDAL